MTFVPAAGGAAGAAAGVEDLRAALSGAADARTANDLLVRHPCWHGAGTWRVDAWDQDAHASSAMHANAGVMGRHAAPEEEEAQQQEEPATPPTPATPVELRGEGT